MHIMEQLFCTRKNVKMVDFRLSVFFTGIAGLSTISIVFAISRRSCNLALLSDGYIYTLLVSGVVIFLGFNCEVLALRFERAGIISLFMNTEILLAYTFDVTIQHKTLTLLGIFGVFMVLCASLLVIVNKL